MGEGREGMNEYEQVGKNEADRLEKAQVTGLLSSAAVTSICLCVSVSMSVCTCVCVS